MNINLDIKDKHVIISKDKFLIFNKVKSHNNKYLVKKFDIDSTSIDSFIHSIEKIIFNLNTKLVVDYIDVYDNNVVCSENNCLLTYDRTMLLLAATYFILPDSVKSIHRHAFEFSQLTLLKFTKSYELYPYAFYNVGKHKLTKIDISNFNCKILPIECFGNNNNVEQIILPDSVELILQFTFERCYKLKTLSLPINLNSILYGAFELCRSLTTIIVNSNITNCALNVFLKCKKLEKIIIQCNYVVDLKLDYINMSSILKIYVPDDLYDDYMNASFMKNLKIGKFHYFKISEL